VSIARCLLPALLLGTAACTQNFTPDSAQLRALGGVANEVNSQRLFQGLTELTELHTGDTPIDCAGLKFDVYPEFCHLSHDQARTRIQLELESLGLTVTYDKNLQRGYVTTNLIAELPGSTHPEEIVLIGAHYDAFYAGADDNTSGAAIVLELARVLTQHRYTRTLRFVAFDLEEIGLEGSFQYVSALKGDRLTASIIFDTVGYYSSMPNTQDTLPGLPAPNAGDFILVVANSNEGSVRQLSELNAINKALDLQKTVTIEVPQDGAMVATGPLTWSDHTPLWLNGHPSLFFTDTGPFRNPHYHRKSDTPDTLDPEMIGKTTRLATAAIAQWAGGPL